MTIPGQSCPDALTLHTSDSLRLCGKSVGFRCISAVVIPVNGQLYQQVRGKVKAYQYYSTDGFLRWSGSTPTGGNDDIESAYVDGISITHGQSPRKHVWTYVVGWRQYSGERQTTRDKASCPSSGYGQSQPGFVGDNYFCSSGNPGPANSRQLFPTPLFSNILGTCSDCGSDDLFFCVNLPEPTTDDLEVRVCTDETLGNEDVRIESMDFYIQ